MSISRAFLLLVAAASLIISCSSPRSLTLAPDLPALEDTLKKLGQIILSEEEDSVKEEASTIFSSLLLKALSHPSTIRHHFDSVRTMAVLSPANGRFRIYNWSMPRNDGSYQYFGFIQVKHRDRINVFTLKDKSGDMEQTESKVTGPENWYGCLYYTVIAPEKKTKNYILLGWDGNDRLSNKKIIEVLSFDGKGFPKFGGNVLRYEKKNPKRIIFEYAEDAVMSLKYYPEQQMVIFDHLSPREAYLKGNYQYYGPDLSYDALRYEKGIWHYMPDVDIKNLPDRKRKYNIPE